MATHAGLATSKIVILALGAGVTTQIITGKATLSEILTTVQETISKVQRDDSNIQSTDNDAIQAQILRLTQEVKQLYGGRQIMVVNSSERSNASSYIVPIAILGVAGYGYMWWKGWSFSDIMYVTKQSMTNYVSAFTKQLEQVSETIIAAKKQLLQRMERVYGKLEEQKETTEAIKIEVGDARESLAQMGLDVESVRCLVEGLEEQVDRVEGKQDHINAGVVYLCQFVQGFSVGQRPEMIQSTTTKVKLEPSPTKVMLEQSPSSSTTGLKELQFFKETLQSDGTSNKSHRKSVTSTTEATPESLNTLGTVLRRGMKVS